MWNNFKKFVQLMSFTIGRPPTRDDGGYGPPSRGGRGGWGRGGPPNRPPRGVMRGGRGR